MRRLLPVLVVVSAAALAIAAAALAQPKPEFRLGFKALADQIPGVAGEPLEEEHWGANGDSLQRTGKGLMVWRKADNWTAFTDGSRTWINGPNGVQDRGNEERFEWEAGASSIPDSGPAEARPTAPPAPPSTGPEEARDWTIARVHQAATADWLEGDPGYSPFNPGSAERVFLLVRFELKAGSQAKPLDAQGLVLTVDGSTGISPTGWASGVVKHGYVGSFSGTFAPGGGADLFSKFTRIVPSSPFPQNATVGWKNASPEATLVYEVPQSYLDAKRRFQLTIAGSGGVDLPSIGTLDPPPQGYVALSSDGSYVTLTRDKTLSLFERGSNVPLWSYTGKDSFHYATAISGDGSHILASGTLASGTKAVMLFHRSRAEPVWVEDLGQYGVIAFTPFAMSATGNRAALAGNKEKDRRGSYVYVFDVPSGRPIARLGDRTGINGALTYVNKLALSADGRYLAVAGGDMLYLFDTSTSSEIWRYKNKPGKPGDTSFADGVALSAGGEYVAVVFRISGSSNSSQVLLFQRGSSTPLWDYVAPGKPSWPFLSPLFSADGSHLAVYGFSEMALFSRSGGTPLWYKSFGGGVQSVAMSPSGELVAAGYGSTVRLLDRAGATLSSRDLGRSVAISNDGRTMAVSSNSSARLLNLPELTTIWEYRFP